MGLSAVMRGRRDERSLTRVPVAQGAAGTTQLIAAVLGKKHAIVGGLLTMSAAGTMKFTDSTPADLSGAFDIATQGGFAIPQDDAPLLQGGSNKALSIVTTTGAARGVVLIETTDG